MSRYLPTRNADRRAHGSRSHGRSATTRTAVFIASLALTGGGLAACSHTPSDSPATSGTPTTAAGPNYHQFCQEMDGLASTLAVVPTLPTTSPVAASTTTTYTGALTKAAHQLSTAAANAPTSSLGTSLNQMSSGITTLNQNQAGVAFFLGGPPPANLMTFLQSTTTTVVTPFTSVWSSVVKQCPNIKGNVPSVLPNLPGQSGSSTPLSTTNPTAPTAP